MAINTNKKLHNTLNFIGRDNYITANHHTLQQLKTPLKLDLRWKNSFAESHSTTKKKTGISLHAKYLSYVESRNGGNTQQVMKASYKVATTPTQVLPNFIVKTKTNTLGNYYNTD